MELSARHKEYWRKNLTVTAILLAIWFVVTFVDRLLRPRSDLQLLRLAVRVLGRRRRAR